MKQRSPRHTEFFFSARMKNGKSILVESFETVSYLLRVRAPGNLKRIGNFLLVTNMYPARMWVGSDLLSDRINQIPGTLDPLIEGFYHQFDQCVIHHILHC